MAQLSRQIALLNFPLFFQKDYFWSTSVERRCAGTGNPCLENWAAVGDALFTAERLVWDEPTRASNRVIIATMTCRCTDTRDFSCKHTFMMMMVWCMALISESHATLLCWPKAGLSFTSNSPNEALFIATLPAELILIFCDAFLFKPDTITCSARFSSQAGANADSLPFDQANLVEQSMLL